MKEVRWRNGSSKSSARESPLRGMMQMAHPAKCNHECLDDEMDVEVEVAQPRTIELHGLRNPGMIRDGCRIILKPSDSKDSNLFTTHVEMEIVRPRPVGLNGLEDEPRWKEPTRTQEPKLSQDRCLGGCCSTSSDGTTRARNPRSDPRWTSSRSKLLTSQAQTSPR